MGIEAAIDAVWFVFGVYVLVMSGLLVSFLWWCFNR